MRNQGSAWVTVSGFEIWFSNLKKNAQRRQISSRIGKPHQHDECVTRRVRCYRQKTAVRLREAVFILSLVWTVPFPLEANCTDSIFFYYTTWKGDTCLDIHPSVKCHFRVSFFASFSVLPFLFLHIRRAFLSPLKPTLPLLSQLQSFNFRSDIESKRNGLVGTVSHKRSRTTRSQDTFNIWAPCNSSQ